MEIVVNEKEKKVTITMDLVEQESSSELNMLIFKSAGWETTASKYKGKPIRANVCGMVAIDHTPEKLKELKKANKERKKATAQAVLDR